MGRGAVDFYNMLAKSGQLIVITAETFQTNLTAQFFTSVAFLPLLAKGTANTLSYSSSIVNIASVSGVLKGSSQGQFAYSTSKAGISLPLHSHALLSDTNTNAQDSST